MRVYTLLYILFSVSTAFAQKATETESSILEIGKSYIGTKYVANVLDRADKERLIICKDSVDCVTLVEYTLAQALTNGSFESNVQKIRYRNGIIDGYPSRMHYASDWINNGIKNGIITDITATNSPYTTTLSISYMSTHYKQYPQLLKSSEDRKKIKDIERRLTGQVVHWIPKSQLSESGYSWIKSGDIIAITTKIPGLDIAHLGIAIYIDNKLYLLHASSTKKQVIISESPISKMLIKNKSWSGIRILRMLQQ